MRGDIVPKFYICSDLHGFYDEFRAALDNSEFDENNPEHWLVSLGDEMDRGPNPEGVINYIMNLPRAIWVKGNHQTLMEDLIARGYPGSHDWHNGTMQSVMDLAPNAKTLLVAFMIAYDKTKPFFDKAIDYLELKNYILVHSFIPLKNLDGMSKYYTRNRKFEFDPDWRHAHASAWEEARWGNPFDLAEKGFLPDKTLVFGHYHTSWPRYKYEGKPEMGDKADFSPYYGNGYIGIDACTARSKKVNILVLEDEFLT